MQPYFLAYSLASVGPKGNLLEVDVPSPGGRSSMFLLGSDHRSEFDFFAWAASRVSGDIPNNSNLVIVFPARGYLNLPQVQKSWCQHSLVLSSDHSNAKASRTRFATGGLFKLEDKHV
jgi:hypothetical protein